MSPLIFFVSSTFWPVMPTKIADYGERTDGRRKKKRRQRQCSDVVVANIFSVWSSSSFIRFSRVVFVRSSSSVIFVVLFVRPFSPRSAIFSGRNVQAFGEASKSERRNVQYTEIDAPTLRRDQATLNDRFVVRLCVRSGDLCHVALFRHRYFIPCYQAAYT